MRNRVILWVSIFCFFGHGLTGQSDIGPQDSVEVIKQFNAKLLKSKKIKFSPELPQFDTSNRAYYYQIDIQQLEYPEVQPEMNPDRYQFASAYENSPLFYAELGYGFPNYLNAKASYNFYNEVSDFHAFVDHQQLGYNDEFRDLSLTNGGISGSFYAFDHWKIAGKIIGTRKLDQYTPLLENTMLDEDDATTSWNRWNAKLSAERFINDWNWSNQLSMNFLKDDSGPRDQKINLASSLTKTLSKSTLMMQPGLIIHNVIGSFEDTDFHQFYIDGGYSYLNNTWSFDVGGTLARANSDFILLPDLSLSWTNNKWWLNISSSSDLIAQSHGYLLIQNPFLQSDSLYHNFQTNYTQKFHIQTIWKELKLEGYGLYQNFTQMAFFTKDLSEGHLFDIETYDGSLTTVGARATIDFLQYLKTGGEIKFHHYNLKNQGKPWLKPTSEYSTFVRAETEKFTASFSMLLMNGLKYLDEDEERELPSILELNAEVTYRLGQRWFTFVRLNNMLARQNQQLPGYRQPGINGLLGVSYLLTNN